jgi:predicted permease
MRLFAARRAVVGRPLGLLLLTLLLASTVRAFGPTTTLVRGRSVASFRTRPTPLPTARSALPVTMIALDPRVATASLAATAKLLSSIGLGALAARQPGLLDAATLGALSRLVYWVFQPAFLFQSVSRTLHTATTAAATGSTSALSVRALTLLPALAVVQIVSGHLAGRALTKGLRITEPTEVKNVQMCTTFGNSGPLPLIFADALFGGGNGLLQSQVTACISFYLLAWSPLFWTFGKIILRDEADDDNAVVVDDAVPRWKRQWNSARTTLMKILSPPVLGSLAGLFVGLCPPLRRAFFGGLLTPLYGSVQTLGTAYLPAALLVLAGSLVGGGGAKKEDTEVTAETTTTTTESTAPSVRGVIAICLSRFGVSPLVSLFAVRLLAGLTWMDGRTRAILTFVLLMQGCMPPAQNSVILLQLAGRRKAAARMAQLLTLLYAGAVVPVTLLLTACLSKSGILAFL